MTAFPLKCGSLAAGANGAEGVRESVAGLSGHSLTAKGGNEGCLSGRLVRPGRASTFFLFFFLPQCFGYAADLVGVLIFLHQVMEDGYGDEVFFGCAVDIVIAQDVLHGDGIGYGGVDILSGHYLLFIRIRVMGQ